MTGHIYTALPIKHLVKKCGEPTTPNKLATDAKSSVSNLRVLFCPCVVQKATAHVNTKALNIFNQSQQQKIRVSLLESYNIKKGTSYTYLVHGKKFLHMTLYVTKVFLVS